jgi:hypothetical protein
MDMRRTMLVMLLPTLLISTCNRNASADTQDTTALETVAVMTLDALDATMHPLVTATPWPSSTMTPTVQPSAQPTSPIAPTAAPVVVVSSSICDASSFLDDVTIPDGTEFSPGTSFDKTWEFENTGTCTWSTSYKLVFVSGEDMEGSSTALSESVSPGEDTEITVSLVAPEDEGTYTGYWRMRNADRTMFGESAYVQIVVDDDAATVTPTSTAATSTPTSTTASASTATPTSAPTATSTPVPTSTTDTSESTAPVS